MDGMLSKINDDNTDLQLVERKKSQAESEAAIDALPLCGSCGVHIINTRYGICLALLYACILTDMNDGGVYVRCLFPYDVNAYPPSSILIELSLSHLSLTL